MIKCDDLSWIEDKLVTHINTINSKEIIDEFIIDEVIELNKLGFVTLFSCSGHANDPYPYVYGVVPDSVYMKCLSFLDRPESKAIEMTAFSKANNRFSASLEEKSIISEIVDYIYREQKGRALKIQLIPISINEYEKLSSDDNKFVYSEDLVDGDGIPWMTEFRNSLRELIKFLNKRNVDFYVRMPVK